MPATDKRLPKDQQGLPVNSHYDEGNDEHRATKGAGNGARVRIADGDHMALGARDDEPSSGALTGSFSLISVSKEILTHVRTLAS